MSSEGLVNVLLEKAREVVINPDTQKIVSVNPTSTKKAEKLISESLNGKN